MTAATGKFTFKKEERLAGRKIMADLFAKGKSISHPPFRLTWMESTWEETSPVKIGFGVPARVFRLAVDRNRIKRQMREVYRNNKEPVIALVKARNKQCAIMILFTGKEKLSFEEIGKKLKLTLLEFEKDFKKYAG